MHEKKALLSKSFLRLCKKILDFYPKIVYYILAQLMRAFSSVVRAVGS